MDLIEETTRELGAAIDRAKQGDPWRSVVVLVPSVVSALQWRRRVARARGGLFRVQWHDPAQQVAELLASAGEESRAAPQAVQLAAAWKVLQTAPAELSRHRHRPELPAQLVQAFRAYENLSEPDKAEAGTLLSEAYERWIEALKPYGTIGRDRAAAARRLRAGDFETFAPILLSAGTRTHAEEEFQTALRSRAVEIPLLRGPIGRVAAEEVHDEADEVERVAGLVQDAALGEPSVHPSDFAVVVPARDPWSKWLERSGIPWNGLAPRTLREGAAGVAVAEAVLAGATWTEIVDGFTSAVEGAPALEAQSLRDQADAWRTLQEVGIAVDPVLLEALRSAALDRPAPRTSAFGDGVFVGLPHHFTGLAFRRMAVLGVTAHRYPSARRSIPLLKPGLGVPDAMAQRRQFDDLLRVGGDIVLLSSRSDRRNGREAFPSPWIHSLCRTPLRWESALQVVESEGPRTVDAEALSDALTAGVPSGPAAALRSRWESVVPDREARVDGDLTVGRTLSPTQLERLLTCPRRWYLDQCSGMRETREEVEIGFDPAEIGKAVHAAMASLVRTRADQLADPSYGWTPDDHAFARDAFTAALLEQKPDSEIVAQREIVIWHSRLDRLLTDDAERRHARRARPLEVEVELKGEIAGLSIEGRCDRIDVAPDGGRIVIDYKTGAFRKSQSALEKDPTLQGTLLQGLLYLRMANERDGVEATGSAQYWHLRGATSEKRKVEQAADPTGLELLEDRVRLAGDLLREGWIPMRPTRDSRKGLCPYCPWSGICPGDREAIVARQTRGASGAYRRYLDMLGVGDDSVSDDGEVR